MLPTQMRSQPTRFIIPPLVMSTIMSSKDQKQFQRFTRSGPSRFSGVVHENAYKFLTDYREKLYNLGLHELHGVSYTTYQLKGVARVLQRLLVHFRTFDSPEMTQNQFSNVFLERFVPYNIRDRMQDEFDRLEQGSMTIADYEAHFDSLSIYSYPSISTELRRFKSW